VLTLSDRAVETIRALTSQPGLPADTGLRMSLPDGADGEAGRVALSLERPHPDDAVIEDAGARVFVDTHVAPVVGNSELDAEFDQDGRAAFTLTEHRAQAPQPRPGTP
jgi:iron-sulfur cluster assembly protein